jgi:hypothetical protein
MLVLCLHEESLTFQTLGLAVIVFKDLIRFARLTHCISVIKTIQSMVYREIIAVCSQIYTKHINILHVQNVEVLFVKSGVTYRIT